MNGRSTPTAARALLPLAALILTTLASQAQAPPAGRPRSVEEADYIRELAGAFKREAKRQSGVLLTAKIEVRTGKDDADILLHWQIDYAGPRYPLIILKPSLEAPISTPSQTKCYVTFYPYSADEDEAKLRETLGPQFPVGFWAPLAPKGSGIAKEHFLTIKKGEVGRGSMPFKASRLFKEIRRRWPERFGKKGPRLLYLRLVHFSLDRGERFNLDAWTGELQTELLPVPLERLKFN